MTSPETMELDLADAIPLTSAYISAFFRPFVERGGARTLVRAILGDEDRLAWCAANGYPHHNDFTKIVLGVSPAGRKLVWHEWRQARPWADGDRHNHRWDFVSYVAVGELELTDFEEHPDGPLAATRYVYESPGEREEYSLRRAGTARLREVRRVKVAAGEFYHQPHRIVHSASSRSWRTGTLIVQGDVTTDRTDVYPTGAGAERVGRTAPRFSPDALRPLLEGIRDVV